MRQETADLVFFDSETRKKIRESMAILETIIKSDDPSIAGMKDDAILTRYGELKKLVENAPEGFDRTPFMEFGERFQRYLAKREEQKGQLPQGGKPYASLLEPTGPKPGPSGAKKKKQIRSEAHRANRKQKRKEKQKEKRKSKE